jgi:hypothetical protein
MLFTHLVSFAHVFIKHEFAREKTILNSKPSQGRTETDNGVEIRRLFFTVMGTNGMKGTGKFSQKKKGRSGIFLRRGFNFAGSFPTKKNDRQSTINSKLHAKPRPAPARTFLPELVQMHRALVPSVHTLCMHYNVPLLSQSLTESRGCSLLLGHQSFVQEPTVASVRCCCRT